MDLDSYVISETKHDAGNKHGMVILGVMNELRHSREFCDVIIRIGDKDIYAHKLVLVSLCSYFRAMFTGDMKEHDERVIELKDLDSTCVELLVDYAYTGKVVLTQENVQNMLYSASFLQLADVQCACEEFLISELHPTNCLGIHYLALRHACTKLSEVSCDFIRSNFSKVVEGEEFLKLEPLQFGRFLQDNNLKVDNEETIYFALMTWIKYDIKTRKSMVSEFLSKVRLAFLSPEFLVDIVSKEVVILDDSSARLLLDKTKDMHVLPQRWLDSDTCVPRCTEGLALFTVGGMECRGHSLNTVELLYPSSVNVDSTKAPMNCPRSGLGVVVLHGNIYAVGGYDGHECLRSVECYNPCTNSWKFVSPMSDARRYVGVTAWNGLVCAAGGHNGTTVLDTVETYDPKFDCWQPLPKLNFKRRHVAIHCLNGLLYAVGGHDGSNYLSSVERYDGSTWQIIKAMHKARAGVAVSCLTGVLYAVGGYDGKENLSSCERYYPDEDRWTKIAPMNVSRSGHGLNVIGQRLYVSGGHDGQCYLNAIEWYHPSLGEWKFVDNVGSCRAVAGTCVLAR